MPDPALLRRLLTEGETGLTPELIDALPVPWRCRRHSRGSYDLSDKALITAVKAALLLGQPLILAGEPGVGKTTLAEALAERFALRLHDPLQVKSTTKGLDLFYDFDEVARFRDASRSARDSHAGSLRDYVRFSSLGRAVLWSAGPDAQVTVGSIPAGEIMEGAGDRKALLLRELFPEAFELRGIVDGELRTAAIDEPTQSMVLIDELDKAPRDAPNDILGEIEALKFRILELDIEIAASPKRWPYVLITSNSERSFPDAFLRRCVYHWIDYPQPDRLMAIAAARCDPELGLKPDDEIVRSAVALFNDIRDRVENKKPSTAELISFLTVLLNFGLPHDKPIDRKDHRVTEALGVLVKTQIDAAAVQAGHPSVSEG